MSRDFGSRSFRARGNCLQRVTRPEAPERLQSLKALKFPCSREVRLDPVMRPALLRERILEFRNWSFWGPWWLAFGTSDCSPGYRPLRPRQPAEAELISRANRLVVLEINFQHLLALNIDSSFVLQAGDDLACRHFDHIAGGRVCILSVNAERDPAGLIAQRDAGDLFRGLHRRVRSRRREEADIEDVQPAVVRVGQPQFLLVWRQSNAVTRTPVPFGRAFLEPLHFDTVQHFAGRQVADFKSKQIIYVNKAERPATVDGEGSNEVAERPDFKNDLVPLRIGHREQWRPQSSQISAAPIETNDCIVRA